MVSLDPERWDEECIEARIHTSPGASGTYPLVDLRHGYHYYFGMDQVVGLGAVISAVFRDTLKPLVDAAVAGRSAEGLARAVPKARVACLMRVAAEAEVAGDEGNQTRWLDLRQC